MMKQKIYRCSKCGEKLSKRVYDCYDGYCMICNPQVFINIKTGRTLFVDHNSIGNPLVLTDGREVQLAPDNYIVTTKFGDSFFISSDYPDSFRNDNIVVPLDDLTLGLVESAIKRLKTFRRGVGVEKACPSKEGLK